MLERQLMDVFRENFVKMVSITLTFLVTNCSFDYYSLEATQWSRQFARPRVGS